MAVASDRDRPSDKSSVSRGAESVGMHARRLGMVLRALRHRSRLTQAQLGALCGVSRSVVSKVELGEIAGVTVGTLVAVIEAAGARLELRPLWHGAALDRLMDEGHARLSSRVIRFMRQREWDVEVEVSYSIFGERGSIDLLAWHSATGTLLVVEIKTELGSVERLLRPLDAKVRLATKLASERFGWRALRVGRLVVFPEEMTVRRQVDRHRDTLGAALPMRSREVRSWLRQPHGTLAAIWFFSDPSQTSVTRNPSSILRVRTSARGSRSA